MELLTAIETRSSAARLTGPGPSTEQLARIIAAAERAPDHGRLKPWKIVVLAGIQRERFAVAVAEAKRLRVPTLTGEQVAAEREKFLKSPCVVIIGCAVQRANAKIPEIEQIAAVSAAAQNLFLAAFDLGFGVMWKTGAAAYDESVKALVDLKADDHIIGIMHVGTRAA